MQATGVSRGILGDSMTARNRLGASARGIPRVPPGGDVPPTPLVYFFGSPDFDDPNSAAWAVNAIAPAATDTLNAEFQVRRFDDTTEEGVGFELFLASDFDQLELRFIYRAQAAPAGAVAVQPNLYVQQIPNNVAVPVWSAAIVLTPLAVPANVFWQYATQLLSYADLGATADLQTKFELTRTGTSGSDTLVGDWTLYGIVATLKTL